MTQPLDKERLKKLLLVALSSDQPGEAMAALGKVRGVLSAAGHDIHWLVDTITGHAPARATAVSPFHKTDRQTWLEQLLFCVENLDRIRAREVVFIHSLFEQHDRYGDEWEPTPKQAKWLDDIYQRLS
jgi:hypothetical protein